MTREKDAMTGEGALAMTREKDAPRNDGIKKGGGRGIGEIIFTCFELKFVL